MSRCAAEIIAQLQLQPLPGEGGFYRETYRAATSPGQRATGTAIYYLLTSETVSRFHRLQQDEVWHFYQGDVVELVMLQPQGTYLTVTLGHDLAAGEQCQVVVPARNWQGARVKPAGQWALMGCTVAPGFEFADWELGTRDALLTQFPQAADWILQLT